MLDFEKTSEGDTIPREIGNYDLIKQIGVGSFSYVYLAVHKICKVEVAIKIIPKKRIASSMNTIRFEREVSTLKQLDHPLIAQLFETLEDDLFHYFVMELAKNGDLLSYINKVGKLNEISAKQYFVQILSVLEYMHKVKKVAHRDLKAENILLDENDNVRIIDFGFSISFTDDNPNLQTKCGSPAYIAPEIINGEDYTNAADIWSIGVVLYAMVTGKLPFEDPSNSVQAILQKIVDSDLCLPKELSPELKQLIQRMLCRVPSRRITINEIKIHTWYSNASEERLCSSVQGVFDGFVDSSRTFFLQSVSDKMKDIGMNVTGLKERLISRIFDQETSAYLMIRKQMMTEKLKDLVTSELKEDEASSYKSNYDDEGQTDIILPQFLNASNRVRVKTPRRAKTGPPVKIPAFFTKKAET